MKFNSCDILLLVILLVIIYVMMTAQNERNEHFALSNEAIQNINSVYSTKSGTVAFNNANVTQTLDTQNINSKTIGATLINSETINSQTVNTKNIKSEIINSETIDAKNINVNSLTRKTNETDYIWGTVGTLIFRCRAPCLDGAWQQMNGSLTNVSVGKDYIYGVNSGKNILHVKNHVMDQIGYKFLAD